MVIDFFLALLGAGWFAGSAASSGIGKAMDNIIYKDAERRRQEQAAIFKSTYEPTEEMKERYKTLTREHILDVLRKDFVEDPELGEGFYDALRRACLDGYNTWLTMEDYLKNLLFSRVGRCGGFFLLHNQVWATAHPKSKIPGTKVSIEEARMECLRLIEKNLRAHGHPAFRFWYVPRSKYNDEDGHFTGEDGVCMTYIPPDARRRW